MPLNSFVALFGLLTAFGMWMGMGGDATADQARFDLLGPTFQIDISRNDATLPLRQVPYLKPGDQISVRAMSRDLPHAIIVLAFLRGASSPPPRSWFVARQTWGKKSAWPLRATVPQGAEQAVLFVAPATGGDFDTLVNAVTGRPGAFVRTAQDLNQASHDRLRLDAYVRSVARLNVEAPSSLKTLSPTLARSLMIKLDSDCLAKSVEQQAGCLTEGRESLVLSDGRDTSWVQALTSGVPADLVQQISSTPKAGKGYYSPYISTFMDIARLLDGFHTAQYQYIPALTLPEIGKDEVRLILNTAPSFYNPKSVIVSALPPVAPSHSPSFKLAEPTQPYCLTSKVASLSIEGPPLAFATEFAHDLVLNITDSRGKLETAPATLDPIRGGLSLKPHLEPDASRSADGTARLVGQWGFDRFEGPLFHLNLHSSSSWTVDPANASELVAGRRTDIRIHGEGGDCLESASLRVASGSETPLEIKSRSGDDIVLSATFDATSGEGTIRLTFSDKPKPVEMPIKVYSPLPKVKSFEFHEGDAFATVRGERVDQISSIKVGDSVMSPSEAHGIDALRSERLTFSAQAAPPTPRSGVKTLVEFKLSDGRQFTEEATVEAPRPVVKLLSKSIERLRDASSLSIDFGASDSAPLGSKLTFSLQAIGPTHFSKRTIIQLSTDGGDSYSSISPHSDLVIEDQRTAVVHIDTAKYFDISTHGQLLVRIDSDDGVSDWVPITFIVRYPTIIDYGCPSIGEGKCWIRGENLFLIQTISSDEGFHDPVEVPPGLTASEFEFRNEGSQSVFLRLRDNPAATLKLTRRTLVSSVQNRDDSAPKQASLALWNQNKNATEPARSK